MGLLVCSLARPSAAAKELVVHYKHETGQLSAKLERKDKDKKDKEDKKDKNEEDVKWDPDDPIKVPPGTKVRIQVDATNTALYTFRASTTESDTPEAEELKKFITAFKPYPEDLIGALIGPRPGVAAVPPESEAYGDVLRTLTAVHHVAMSACTTLVAMQRGNSFETAKEEFIKNSNSQLESDSTTLKLRKQLMGALAALPNGATTGPPSQRNLDLLSDADKILAYVSEVESLVVSIRTAKQTWSKPFGTVEATKTRSATLVVSPKRGGLQSALAGRSEQTIKFEVGPRWWLQPNVGLGLLVSPGSEFTTFEVDKSGGTPTPKPTGSFDSRVTYGLSLALTPPVFHEFWGEVSFWPIEITINPSDDVRAIGLGVAASRGFFKLSTGWLWTRHQIPSGETIDETYGKPEWFIGLGFGGWLE